MDQSQGNSQEKSFVNLSILPTEILVYIISFLSSLRDKVKLRYVSRWLRRVTEGTPSLWKEFLWPYYGSHEEYSVKEVLKVCGENIKVLSFPNSRVTPMLEDILQYCSNVQHLSLPLIKDLEQVRKTIHHMGCLQTLELKMDKVDEIKQLLIDTSQLTELVVILYEHCNSLEVLEAFKRWKELEFRPSNFKLIISGCTSIDYLVDYVTQLTNIPTGVNANFRVYDRHIPLSFSPSFPRFQLQVEGSGKVTTPCIKLSDFGILGLENDVAMMTDCQYDGRTTYKVRYLRPYILNKIMNFMHIVKLWDLLCSADLDLSYCCSSLHSGHLEQLAIACPNLQRLNLSSCSGYLNNLQGLRAIASHCENLQGLNMGQICISNVEGHILLWKILSDMKLTHLTMNFCVLRYKFANKKALFRLYQKCFTIRGIQLNRFCCKGSSANKDALILSYFPSLNYCNLEYRKKPAMVQDIINNCKELKCVRYSCSDKLLLNLVDNHNLQQLYIDASLTDVPDEFLTSVSAHGGLVHVVMIVRSSTAEGITSLIRNSHKLITLYVFAETIHRLSVENFNATLKEMFCNRRLFTAGHYICGKHIRNLDIRLWEQGADLLPLWN